jgi:nucleoside-diphosphate-sugar epimerase
MTHVMIFGAGFSGKAIATALQPLATRISGTTRSTEKFASLEAAGITPFQFDGETFGDELSRELQGVTHLIQSISPASAGDPVLRLAGGDLRRIMPKLQWMTYLSTVGVYGDHGGAWVDEDSLCKPVSTRSKERVTAENAWTEATAKANIGLVTLRLSGIYGPGRNAFRNLDNGTARRLIKKDQVFNRIRVEDIGAATAFLLERNASGIFNITDSEPCPPQDVVTYAASLMGVEPPPEQAFETAELTPMARSFYGENKRVSNASIRQLGFKFTYPDYRISLRQLWEDGAWKG